MSLQRKGSFSLSPFRRLLRPPPPASPKLLRREVALVVFHDPLVDLESRRVPNKERFRQFRSHPISLRKLKESPVCRRRNIESSLDSVRRWSTNIENRNRSTSYVEITKKKGGGEQSEKKWLIFARNSPSRDTSGNHRERSPDPRRTSIRHLPFTIQKTEQKQVKRFGDQIRLFFDLICLSKRSPSPPPSSRDFEHTFIVELVEVSFR